VKPIHKQPLSLKDELPSEDIPEKVAVGLTVRTIEASGGAKGMKPRATTEAQPCKHVTFEFGLAGDNIKCVQPEKERRHERQKESAEIKHAYISLSSLRNFRNILEK